MKIEFGSKDNKEKILKEKAELKSLKAQRTKITKELKKDYRQFNILKKRRLQTEIKKLKDKKCLMVNMTLNSGFVDTLLIHENDSSFSYEGGEYVVDLNMKYWSVPAKYYCLDYHQGFPLPIKRVYDIDKLNTAIESEGKYDFEMATNPILLKRFIMSKIVSQVVSGGALANWLQSMKFMIISILIIVIVITLILLFKMGILPGAGG